MWVKAKLAPGINKNSTRSNAIGGWWDCNNIRWQNGQAESILGWEDEAGVELNGFIRRIHTWLTIDGFLYTIVGTNQKLYIIYANTAYDITPIRASVDATTITMTSTGGDSLIQITHASHGANAGDWITTDSITFGSGSFGGVAEASFDNKSGEGWRITQVIDANNYIVDCGFTLAADTDTPTNGDIYYQLYTGLNTSVLTGFGWGIGGWGSSTWGGPSTVTGNEALNLRLWSVANRGEDIIACPRGGELYYWSVADSVDANGTPNTDLTRRAVTMRDYATANSLVSVDIPKSNNMFFIDDDEGRIVSLGCNQFSVDTDLDGDFGAALVRWSDNDLNDKDIFDWGPRSTNTSGGKVLEKGSVISGYIQTNKEKIIWTDTAMYSMRNIGPPYVYSIDVIGENVSILSPNAATVVGDVVYFMGDESFYAYRGVVQPLQSSVEDYVFHNMNKSEYQKIYCVTNQRYNEVTWFYCSTNSFEIDSYVTYNYIDNVWYIGNFDMAALGSSETSTSPNNRTAWLPSGINENPVSAYVKSQDTSVSPTEEISGLFVHDNYYTADGSNIDVYLYSGDFAVEEVDDVVFVRGIIPDFTYKGSAPTSINPINILIKSKRYPSTTEINESSVDVVDGSGLLNTRARGKYFSLNITSSLDDYHWRLGDLYIDITSDGRRP